MGVRISELDDVDDVLVAEARTEIVQLLLPNQRVQGIRTNSVSEEGQKNGNLFYLLSCIFATGKTFLMDLPEDPPGDRDHPHDDGDHQHDVVHHVAAKLTEAAGHVIATSLIRRKIKKKS